jgi:hypothetical protein
LNKGWWVLCLALACNRDALTLDPNTAGHEKDHNSEQAGGSNGGSEVGSNEQPVTLCDPLMIILDRSQSMGDYIDLWLPPSRLALATSTVDDLLASNLPPLPVGLTSFYGTSDVPCKYGVAVQDPLPGQAKQIASQLKKLEPKGSTNANAAFNAARARATLPNRPAPILVLFTDGEPNCEENEPARLSESIRSATDAGVRVAVVSVAAAFPNDARLEEWAQLGGLPCAGTICGGHSFFPITQKGDVSDIVAALRTAISSVTRVGCGG